MVQPLSQRYSPGLFDRLIDELAPASSRRAPGWNLEQLKDAVARDLEALFNTRAAMPVGALDAYPEAGRSILSYGLIDFAGMCLSSEEDQKTICAAVKQAVEQHEGRLQNVGAALRIRPESINRLDFVITGRLKADPMAQQVQFDAELKPSSQHYSIHMAGAVTDSGD